MRGWAAVLCSGLFLCGCSGGSGGPDTTATSAAKSDPADPGPAPVPVPQPQMPDVEGEVIGMPGAKVPGMKAHYVTTSLGWLGSRGNVVFEAIIRFELTRDLGCGIFRRGPDGLVNPVLLQGQPLPGTNGGRVKHPRLPVAALGDTLVIPAVIDGGDFVHGLFSVSVAGEDLRLIAGGNEDAFGKAVVLEDGSFVVEMAEKSGSAIVAFDDAGNETRLCERCLPGFSTDGRSVLVRESGAVVLFDDEGTRTEILSVGDPAPGSAGIVTFFRSAWLTKDGIPVVHADTDDPDRPDVLLRFSSTVEILAACGAPAPGVGGSFELILPAAGRSEDVVFGALLKGSPRGESAVFCARPGEPAILLASTGDAAKDLPGSLAVSYRDVVATDGGKAAIAAWVLDGSAQPALGVFTASGAGLERVVTTDARVAAVENTTITGFLFELRDAIDVSPDGRTLVHVGITPDRQPGAKFGALLLRE